MIKKKDITKEPEVKKQEIDNQEGPGKKEESNPIPDAEIIDEVGDKNDGETEIEKMMSEFSVNQEDSGSNSAGGLKIDNEGKTVTEDVDLDLTPSGATKKKGRRRKSVKINLPASVVVRVANSLIAGALYAAMQRLSKKPQDKDEFYLTEAEIEMIQPVVETVLTKYLKDLSPEKLLLIMLAMIYGSKIVNNL